MKHVIIAIIIFIISTSLASAANKKLLNKHSDSSPISQVKIKAFADINWNDGVQDVLIKLNSIEGIDHINLMGENVKGINIPEDLSKAFTKIISNCYIDRFICMSSANEFIDVQNNKYNYLKGFYVITASDVNISGAPFELKITMLSEPGSGILNPGGIIKDDKNDFVLIGYIDEIELSSKSNQLIDSANNIYDFFVKKYDKAAMVHKSKSGDKYLFNAIDTLNNEIDISCSPDYCYIRYKSKSDRLANIKNIYKKHLAEIERAGAQNKKNHMDAL